MRWPKEFRFFALAVLDELCELLFVPRLLRMRARSTPSTVWVPSTNKANATANSDTAKKGPSNMRRHFIVSGVVASSWICCMNGFFGFFSGNPKILLYPLSVATCIYIFIVARRFIGKSHPIFYLLPAGLAASICVFTIKAVYKRELETRNEMLNRQQERAITTNIPSRFDNVDSGISKIRNEVDGLTPKRRIIDSEADKRILSKLDFVKSRSIGFGIEDQTPDTAELLAHLQALFKYENFRFAGMTHGPAVSFGPANPNPPRGMTVILKETPDRALSDALNQIFEEIKQAPQIVVGRPSLDLDMEILIAQPP